MDRDFTHRKVWCNTDPVWFMSRVHAPHGDAIGCLVEIDLSVDVERARRDGWPVPFWNEFVVTEPFQDADPDVLCVEHRDLKTFLDRVLESLKHKR
jgi:hypothetical protein